MSLDIATLRLIARAYGYGEDTSRVKIWLLHSLIFLRIPSFEIPIDADEYTEYNQYCENAQPVKCPVEGPTDENDCYTHCMYYDLKDFAGYNPRSPADIEDTYSIMIATYDGDFAIGYVFDPTPNLFYTHEKIIEEGRNWWMPRYLPNCPGVDLDVEIVEATDEEFLASYNRLITQLGTPVPVPLCCRPLQQDALAILPANYPVAPPLYINRGIVQAYCRSDLHAEASIAAPDIAEFLPEIIEQFDSAGTELALPISPDPTMLSQFMRVIDLLGIQFG